MSKSKISIWHSLDSNRANQPLCEQGKKYINIFVGSKQVATLKHRHILILYIVINAFEKLDFRTRESHRQIFNPSANKNSLTQNYRHNQFVTARRNFKTMKTINIIVFLFNIVCFTSTVVNSKPIHGKFVIFCTF